MEFARLGRSDLSVSRIGFGCWAIGGHGYGSVDDQCSIAAIEAALDAGINLFDTSNVYGFGRSETVLAKALGRRAQDVVIATKFGVRWDDLGKTHKDCSPAHIVSALEQSLRRLRIDCIPLYQLNWHDGVTPLGDVVSTLQRCREAGKIRYFGFSNMLCEQWGALAAEFLTSQFPYGLNERSYQQDLTRLPALGIGSLAYNVLSRGLFSGTYDTQRRRDAADTRQRDPNFLAGRLAANLALVGRLKDIAERYQKSAPQTAIRWALDAPGVTCTLVGMKTEAQVRENCGAAGWRLSAAEWASLAAAA